MVRQWTSEEVELLKELFPNSDVTREDLMKVFKCGWKRVSDKAYVLRLQRFEKGLVDYEYLAKLRQKLPKRIIK